MRRLLLVEDNPMDQNLVQFALGKEFEVVVAKSLQEAQHVMEKDSKFDLILLDIGLPDGDGFDFCTQLQSDETTKDIPLIFLTGKEGENEVVLGFSLGADDYIVKPFSKKELKARIDARIRKATKVNLSDWFEKGDLRINRVNQKVYVKDLSGDSNEVDLTPLEFKLLLFLAQNENRTFSRDQIISNVWGKSVNVSDRNIDTQISGLRKKLGDRGRYVASVYGEGYKFTIN